MHYSITFREFIYVEGKVQKEKICTEVQSEYFKDFRMTTRSLVGETCIRAWPTPVYYC